MFDNAIARKESNARFFGCVESSLQHFMGKAGYDNSYFQPFDSFSDAKKNVKSIIFQPIIDAYLALTFLQWSLIHTTFGLANIAIGTITFDLDDLMTGSHNIERGITDLFDACYLAISIITDCLDNILRLATHTLATIGFSISKAGQAITSSFSSEPEPFQGATLNNK
ncbi:MAG: hypothetical protein QM652_12995 [Legionella sp.]|uniref:hypothetical protein n=1 Tax=Legionella sp. TaxID=459 RepID=UPI0039E3E6FF